MKEIKIVDEKKENTFYDSEIGNFIVLKEGVDDIIIVKNYKYNVIKKKEVSTLDDGLEYETSQIENGDIYVVKPLDNLIKICKINNVNVEEVMKKNNLKTERLFVGQVLKL